MSSRDYYKRQALPPIRDVLGDQLDRPPHHEGAYSFEAVHRALPSADAAPSRSRSTWPPTTGPTLPPIHAPGYTSVPHGHPHGSGHSHSQSHSHAHAHAPAPPDPTNPTPYSFDVLRQTSSGLILASSSSRSQGILRSTRADAGRRHAPPSPHDDDDEQPDARDKRYPCPHCGKRFSRPSSLKTHEVVHSDEKPYECPHPGCGKTFTVPSNMRRHFRKTHEGGGSGDEDADEHYHSHSSARPAPGYSGSGSGAGSGQYYTSARR